MAYSGLLSMSQPPWTTRIGFWGADLMHVSTMRSVVTSSEATGQTKTYFWRWQRELTRAGSRFPAFCFTTNVNRLCKLLHNVQHKQRQNVYVARRFAPQWADRYANWREPRTAGTEKNNYRHFHPRINIDIRINIPFISETVYNAKFLRCNECIRIRHCSAD